MVEAGNWEAVEALCSPAASCKAPPSHVTWIVVVVVMVAMVRVCNLKTGFPLRLLAIGRVRFCAARRSLLKEV